ncbi:hypothetical protein JCM10207_000948 [Rhodosporidiobolus poonsookiae]
MFGDCLQGESPRLPSPWLSRSAGGTPSPLSLPTPDSTPSTPQDAASTPARRRQSFEELELLDGLGEDFDSISISKGRLSGSPRMEEIALIDGQLAGLQPEVDHKGHIEYKLKLPRPTTLHRLEKLRTQLKWRLIEGGGTAFYELGVLDNGVLVGLKHEDMAESLQTLRRMLAGLGGGHVRITRVVRIGGVSSTSLDGDGDTPPSPTSALFPSFEVEASQNDLDLVVPSAPYTPPEPVPLFPPEKKERGPTPFPSTRTPEEQAIFRRDKRDQRRARAAERAALVANKDGSSSSSAPSSGSPSPSPSPAPFPPSPADSSSASSPTPPAAPIPIRPARSHSFRASHPPPVAPRPKPSKPPKPPKASKPDRARDRDPDREGGVERAPFRPDPGAKRDRPPKSPPGMSLYAPILPGDARAGEEVRYVVEAEVSKAVEEGARRRKSSAASAGKAAALAAGAGDSSGEMSEEVLTTEGEADEDEDEEDGDDTGDGEGWSYLEFDLGALSSSVKNGTAAAGAV